MAGNYTKKDFGTGPEEQTLLKDSNGTRIVPKGAEPVRLSPGWEGTGRPDDELNFKGITMDQADLELNPPRDRCNIVLFIMILHGLGALMPWNMFINANDYFVEYKLATNGTVANSTGYKDTFLTSVGLCAQLPNFLFNWLNIFLPLSGNLTTRIAWGLFVQVIIFILTVVLAMIETSEWPGIFFWITMISIVVLNTSNGIYQNSVFGMAAKLPGKYTGAVVLGSNLSGVFTSVIGLLATYFAPTPRTSGIYYFITALFVLLACFDTYFALPINRFYRYHEYLHEKQQSKKKIEYGGKQTASSRPPLWKVFKQCSVQCFNVWFVFFVTLSIFPQLQSGIVQSDPDFILEKKYYSLVMCFLCFNVTAMLGSLFASWFTFPSKKFVTVPILLRALFIPAFMVCNYTPEAILDKGRMYILIDNDWIYLALGIAMGFTSGYFSSNAMMFCSSVVEPQYASTAGMYAAAFLVTGVLSGIGFGKVLTMIITTFLANS